MERVMEIAPICTYSAPMIALNFMHSFWQILKFNSTIWSCVYVKGIKTLKILLGKIERFFSLRPVIFSVILMGYLMIKHKACL